MSGAGKCPCHGCTEETGRSPTCRHDGTCQHGHTEWQRAHIAERTARSKALGWQSEADGVLARGAIKTIKRRRHGR